MPLVEELTSLPDAAECCDRLRGLPYLLFLDSAARGTRLGRYSFLAGDPALVVRSKGRRTRLIDRVAGIERESGQDALALVRSLVASHSAVAIAGAPPFQGGAAGYLGYDWGLTLERLPAPRFDDLAMDDVVIGIYDWVISWDHEAKRAWLFSTGLPETESQAKARRAADRSATVRAWLDGGTPNTSTPNASTANTRTEPEHVRLRAERSGETSPEPWQRREPSSGKREGRIPPSFPVEGGWWHPSLDLRSSFPRSDYLAAVQQVRDYIYAGDIFQANMSQRFEAPLTESPWHLYQRLRTRNAAPFAAYLDFPDAIVLSASPERFLRVSGSGHVETRPIKGTRPRGLGPEHDAALGRALTESAKDRAENLMIVDLLRNDLSRVCKPGTVRVPELFALERYATVHHLVSTVVGELNDGIDALDLLRAAFPGGSITGAPKLRAMEIIAELEPSQRGVYCGSIGYWSVSGELDTNIAIRTATARNGRVYFSAGGGIVADSEPEQEYRETLDKARGLIDALAIPR
jgi:para-aminobenzoate synthetase component I